jgi:N-acetylglucosamine-6-phosphate deacetylase
MEQPPAAADDARTAPATATASASDNNLPRAARGRLLIGGRLVAGAVVFAGGKIRELILGESIPAPRLPAEVYDAALVTPGLIDLQVNGGLGFDVVDGAESLRALAAWLPSTGVTSFLPTWVSSPAQRYAAAGGAFVGARGARGATALGLHFEGPFITPARAGAHSRAAIDAASADLFDDALTRGILSLVTLAPERPGALALIARLRSRGVVVSLGHTDASFEELTAGIDAGASLVTHLYNAMSPFQHRAPGAVGAALTDARVVAALIADGVHVHPAAIRLARAAKGPQGLVLVTDAVAAAGLGRGRYTLANATVVSDGTAVRLASDGATLAGSVLTLDQAVRNYLRFTGASAEEGLHLATEVPARLLGPAGAAKGRLSPDADADLVLWSAALEVERTFVGGVQAWPGAAT